MHTCSAASALAQPQRVRRCIRRPTALRASQAGALVGAGRVGIAPNGWLDFSRCRPCQSVARRAARRHPPSPSRPRAPSWPRPSRRLRRRRRGGVQKGGLHVLALAAVRRRRVVAAACSMWPRRLPAAAARQKVARFVQGTDLRRAWLRCRRDSEEETQVSLSQPELSTAGWLSRLRRKRIWVNTRGRLDSSS